MHVGFWGAAVIVIVFVSWMLYRYLAPHSWKEWTGAGVLQAFIIAFYAEMYGFPLTIYLLARFFGLDLIWGEGGNLWVQLFGTQMAHVVSMVFGYIIVFAGATMVAEGWRTIHRVRRTGQLATESVYGKIRHPQYTGLFMIIFGEGVVHWPTIVSVAALPIIVVAYALLARKEEQQMLLEFGEEYREYKRHVPMFIPRFGGGVTQEA
ncbi:MAG: isoprenylcysteine carboxylmethyltransferase family protein [Gemmatimonadota bacterium]